MVSAPAPLAVIVLLHFFVASTEILPGRYLLLHRASGRYLLNASGRLGPLGSAGGGGAEWDLRQDKEEPSKFLLGHAGSGLFLSLGGSGGRGCAPAALDTALTWDIFRACQGGGVVITDGQGRALGAREEDAAVEDVYAAAACLWALLRPCGADGDGGPAERQPCFPDGSQWSADDCCNVERHGARGNSQCFDHVFTFARCCPGVQELGDPPGEGVDGAANVLCTGERLKGGSRFVKMADFGGEHRWVRSSWLVRSARFDFSGPPPAAPGGRRLRVAAGLPACGGPSLLQEALSILPDTELHIVHMLQGLHGAMLRLSGESSTFLADLSHDMHYLPFFPLLLITLHRATRDARHLRCLSQSVAALAEMPAWQRNAGYDFVLALGYDKPWERREEVYHIQNYDPRLTNVLVLSTHDSFFGDRHALFYASQGGAAYRNIRNVVVPLPFTLNCSSWRRAVDRRRQRGAPRFRVSFAGSLNGPTRTLIAAAAARLRGSLPESEGAALGVRFVTNDSDRRTLSEQPALGLAGLFGGGVSSFGDLLGQSQFCLVLPGDVSDLALRFWHALSVGCRPVVVGGPGASIAVPFAGRLPYERIAHFATVHDVDEAVELLRGLLAQPSEPPVREGAERHLADMAGLFTAHAGCSFPSGEPYLGLLAKELEDRARTWTSLRWLN